MCIRDRSSTGIIYPVTKVIGIKGKINNAGEPSRLIQDKLFSGVAGTVGTYDLVKNVNDYDYLIVKSGRKDNINLENMTLTTVSYTHLDVYKRQIQANTVRFI